MTFLAVLKAVGVLTAALATLSTVLRTISQQMTETKLTAEHLSELRNALLKAQISQELLKKSDAAEVQKAEVALATLLSALQPAERQQLEEGLHQPSIAGRARYIAKFLPAGTR